MIARNGTRVNRETRLKQPFPKLLLGAESAVYGDSIVNILCIKQQCCWMFLLRQGQNSAGIGGHPHVLFIRRCNHGALRDGAIIDVHFFPHLQVAAL